MPQHRLRAGIFRRPHQRLNRQPLGAVKFAALQRPLRGLGLIGGDLRIVAAVDAEHAVLGVTPDL